MKIFRKLRKNLIALGKFKSYLIYALGEIVLIVIGISIAWKINDLNDIRKNKIVEQKIYTNLSVELQTNLRLLKGIVEQKQETIVYLENTLKYVGVSPQKITQGAKDTIINLHNKQVNLLESSINSIVNTNRFEFIESTELKDLIVLYPSKIDAYKQQDEKIKTIIANRIKPIIEKYISLTDMLPNNNVNYKHIKEFSFKSDYQALLENKEYQNSILDRLLQTKIQLTNAKTLQGKTKILIKELDIELN